MTEENGLTGWIPNTGALSIPDPESAIRAIESFSTEIDKPENDYEQGYRDGYNDCVQITEESHTQAAKFLFRKDAPPGENPDAWDYASIHRKEIYYRSAEMIARLYNGWTAV